jgi:hypothetical protein|tara:strand:- start:159 stop:395 length:237 start_codon:yes stop_codon:yes gene_type:complete
MTTFLLILTILYAIYLNIRIKDLDNECSDMTIGLMELDVKFENKSREIDKDIKDCLKTKIVERPRSRGTKRRGKVSKD